MRATVTLPIGDEDQEFEVEYFLETPDPSSGIFEWTPVPIRAEVYDRANRAWREATLGEKDWDRIIEILSERIE